MIAKLSTTRTTALDEPSIPDSRFGAPTADIRRLHPVATVDTKISRRKLRRRVILGNAVAWVAIIVAARLIFFS